MKYDFTTIINRQGKDAIAVEALGTGWAPPAPKEGFEAIPMWVEDMNFATVPTITEAIIERAKHPLFGYFEPSEAYFNDEVEQAGWDVGVTWQDGRMFHGPWAIRMNLALPFSKVQEAFERLRKYVF